MSRLFELKGDEQTANVLMLIDLDKVCMVRLVEQPGQHYPHIQVRWVDGHEDHTVVPAHVAHEFVKAFRAYLTGKQGGAG